MAAAAVVSLPSRPRLRGAVAGAAALLLLGLAAVALAGGSLLGAHGELVAGRPHAGLRVALLIGAALAAGAVSSLAAGAYASGTSLLAGTCGLLAIWTVARLARAGAARADAVTVAREAIYGAALLLAVYVAAWRADLRWTLGPGHSRKVVLAREVALRDLPALAAAAAVCLAVSRAAAAALPAGWTFAGWALAAGTGGVLAQRLFAPRSTLFLWTAPVVALLVGGAAGAGVWAGADGVPPACLAPLGALAAVAGALLVSKKPDP